MTFERATVEDRIKKLRECIGRLDEIRLTPREEFTRNYRHYWLAERGLQLAAEIVFDIANHVLAGAFGRYPETNEDSLDGLRDCGVISPGLHGSIRGFGGFRNILVHAYLRIDEGQVYEHLLKTPDVLRSFSREIIAWTEGQGSSPKASL
jgi:uncharacterized protein YutE (UPF0331/DUF86 family)